ncbi:uncharacterized protein PV09_07311 [Verruconis gallopava]|uniref:Uncharacterized protein n=1 Tax=Verruconis gallopava TaxID=253628 RepID=A0A0D1YK72_9PEZI|nr:uncharacterized protein PV09_07311 [Verruconis gallopava]KIW01272.1 hypothetical protein PV09_07311 [Verruconis gallopava]
MEEGNANQRRSWHLRQEGSDLSSLSSATLSGSGPTSPFSSFGRKPQYQRLGSESHIDQIVREHDEEEGDIARVSRYAGLGIENLERERESGADAEPSTGYARRISIQRVSNASIGQSYTSPRTDSTPGSSNPLISPPLYGDTSRLSNARTAYDPAANSSTEDDVEMSKQKRSSNMSSFNDPYNYDDTAQLNRPKSNYSIRSAFEANDFHPHACPTAKSFYQGRFNWLAMSIVLIALFSTVFSGIFLGIAIRGPRWGMAIRSKGGSLNPSGADILTQVFAKLIELSFVTVFVTFLGQVLSRRAFNSSARGVTIAEFTMRNWVMQPGSMITHYETVKYAAMSFLGILSLSVAAFAMIYSVASSALVAPQLKFGDWESRTLAGLVKAQFSNVVYLQETCQNPIQINNFDQNYDLQNVGNTCLEIDHAAQGYHNYKQYLSYWANLVQVGEANAIDQKARPPGFALHNETIAVNATWINVIDTAKVSKEFNRTINNVTLAFPHAGVVSAGYDSVNRILQPTDLNGEGIYNIRAAVPSPYINVLCANFEQSEYEDFVYQTMPGVTLNQTRDFANLSTWWYVAGVDWKRFTSFPIGNNSLDKVFGWQEPEDRPAFYKFPIDFNTLLNNTRPVYQRDSIYLLGKGDSNKSPDYFMCKIKAGMTPFCSTQYQATANGGSLAAHCEDPDDKLQYIRANSSRTTTTSFDWYDVGVQAVTALSLGTGVSDGAASNSRLLTQLMLTDQALNPALPSPAEALSVLVGCTLLMGAVDTPFVEYWNYTVPSLSQGVYQYFNASVRAQEYASGGTADYQKGFYVVMFAVFILNVFMLAYFLINKGLVTDFSEPPNMFSLAVNSPPNALLAGSCGAGPIGKQFTVNWGIETEGKHLFMTTRKGDINSVGNGATSGYQSVESEGDHEASARGETNFEMDTLSSTPNTLASLGRKQSKFGRHLSMLTKRKSFL